MVQVTGFTGIKHVFSTYPLPMYYSTKKSKLEVCMIDKVFVAKYSSAGNVENGEVVIEAKNISEAQDKFFVWLKDKPLYQHMWKLNVEFREVEEIV
jgi:hypothetical protein